MNKLFNCCQSDQDTFSVKEQSNSENKIQKKPVVKTVILGNSGVGKTTLLKSIKNIQKNKQSKIQEISQVSTQGIEYEILQFLVNNNIKCDLQIWECGGQQLFKSTATNLLKKAEAILLVFSLEDKESFYQLDEWVNLIELQNTKRIERIPVIIAANKCDSENQQIEIQQAEQYAVLHKFRFFQTSSVLEKNVSDIFQILASEGYIYKNKIPYTYSYISQAQNNNNNNQNDGSEFIIESEILSEQMNTSDQ